MFPLDNARFPSPGSRNWGGDRAFSAQSPITAFCRPAPPRPGASRETWAASPRQWRQNMAKANDPKKPQVKNAPDEEVPTVEAPKVAEPKDAPQVENVDVDHLEIDPRFDMHGKDADLSDLDESVSEVGLLEPLIAEKRPDGKARVISGSRRWRFAKLNGWKQVPVQGN